MMVCGAFFFSSRRRHTRFKCDWSSDVCSSDLPDDARISPVSRALYRRRVPRQIDAGKASKGRHMTVLKPGDKAPDFSLPRDGGESLTLSDFRGRKLVLYFYPKADTPGCTREAIDFSAL